MENFPVKIFPKLKIRAEICIPIFFISSIILLKSVSAQSNCVNGNCGGNTVTCQQGYIFSNGQCQLPTQNCYYTCNTGYVLISGLCYLQTPQPCLTQQCYFGCQQPCQTQQCCQCCQSHPPVSPTVVCPPTTTTTQPPTTPYTMTTPKPRPEPTYTTTTPKPRLEIVCPPGYILHEGRCIRLVCPENTTWDGQNCHAVNKVTTDTKIDLKQFTNNHNSISNPTNVNVNNKNTVLVYTADKKIVKIDNDTSTHTTHRPTSFTSTTPAPTITVTTEKPGNCCTVVTPRICSPISGRWVCYNRKYTRCGSFCQYPRIYLKPLRPIRRSTFVVVPPRLRICSGHECGLSYADCSGCETGGSCTPYCYDYGCSQCNFYDQREYCTQYPGQSGCFEHDGCYEDWCS